LYIAGLADSLPKAIKIPGLISVCGNQIWHHHSPFIVFFLGSKNGDVPGEKRLTFWLNQPKTHIHFPYKPWKMNTS